jgi:hypothetical protein
VTWSAVRTVRALVALLALAARLALLAWFTSLLRGLLI